MFLLAQEGEVELCTNLCKSDLLALSYVTYPCLVIHTLEDSANAQDKVQYLQPYFYGTNLNFPNYSYFIPESIRGENLYSTSFQDKVYSSSKLFIRFSYYINSRIHSYNIHTTIMQDSYRIQTDAFIQLHS